MGTYLYPRLGLVLRDTCCTTVDTFQDSNPVDYPLDLPYVYLPIPPGVPPRCSTENARAELGLLALALNR
jgi:hypothetical protein